MLTKEKIDKQLVGQSSSTPFMNIRESQDKKVSFNIHDDLEHKIDRLTVMMDKLVTEDNRCSKPFKPQVYQPSRGRGQNRKNFHGRFRNNVYRGCGSYNQNFRGRYRNNFNNRGNFGYNSGGSQRYRNNYNDYRRNNYRGQGYDRNNADRVEMSHSPMDQWSFLSNIINYMQHSRNPLNFHFVTIKPAKLNNLVKSKDKGKTLPKVNLKESSGRSREEYLDRCEGVKTEIVDITRFDENSDLSTTYLGRIDMT